MKKYDLIKFELGRNNSLFYWSESWSILTYCNHYPTRKVGSGHCKDCKHYVGLIDEGNDKLYVKCAHEYSLPIKIKEKCKKILKNWINL